MNWWYLSSQKMTVCVGTDCYDIIVRCPSIVRTFYGQSLANLIYWMRKQGGFKIEQCDQEKKQSIESGADCTK